MNIFIDLDGVVLNTVGLIASFKDLLVDNGVIRANIDSYYNGGKSSELYMSRTYQLIQEPHRIQEFLDVKSKDHIYQLMGSIEDFLNSADRFVFEDARMFLEKFQGENLFLVSYGGVGWQNTKIDKAGLRGYFKEVIITHGGKKADALQELQNRSSVDVAGSFFIDDRGKEVSLMKRAFPSITAFLVIRPNGKFNHEECHVHDYAVKGLQDVSEIIRDGIGQN